jgi:N-acetylglucosamine-6-phosphate deacetylase
LKIIKIYIFYQINLQNIDCHNSIIAAGFIDIQINGGFGVDFSYDVQTVKEGVNKVAKGILKYGVTSFCPTLVTSPNETYHQVLPQIKKRAGGAHGASVLGVHVEGPFIAKSKKGAHPENCIQEFVDDFKTAEEVYGNVENIKIITLAPEKQNALKVVEEFVKRGVTVSLGHSMSNLEEGEAAVKKGATLITHLFNAMLPVRNSKNFHKFTFDFNLFLHKLVSSS